MGRFRSVCIAFRSIVMASDAVLTPSLVCKDTGKCFGKCVLQRVSSTACSSDLSLNQSFWVAEVVSCPLIIRLARCLDVVVDFC